MRNGFKLFKTIVKIDLFKKGDDRSKMGKQLQTEHSFNTDNGFQMKNSLKQKTVSKQEIVHIESDKHL